MRSITESDTGSALKRRIERRVRRKVWRSVGVKVNRFNFVDDPLLSFSVFPRFIIVFERELVNVLISTLCNVLGNLAADLNITIGGFGVLDDKCHFGTRFHIEVFRAALVGVDQDVIILCIEPYWGDLRRAIGHDGGKKEICFGFVFEKVEIF